MGTPDRIRTSDLRFGNGDAPEHKFGTDKELRVESHPACPPACPDCGHVLTSPDTDVGAFDALVRLGRAWASLPAETRSTIARLVDDFAEAKRR